jgi:hypothetical protein
MFAYNYLTTKMTSAITHTDTYIPVIEPTPSTTDLEDSSVVSDVFVEDEPENELSAVEESCSNSEGESEPSFNNTKPSFAIAQATEPNEVVNFMGGKSFKLTPLDTLKIVSTSMICGENQYYRVNKRSRQDAKVNLQNYVLLQGFYETSETDDSSYFNRIVNNALDFDFEGTLLFIEKLRTEYMMRLNSHYLMVASIHHPSRAKFNDTKPLVMKRAICSACLIPTDWTTQYQLLKATKKPIPTIWKKTIASLLEKMTAYHASKYIHGSKSGNANSSTKKKPILGRPVQVKGRNGKMYYPKRKLPSVLLETEAWFRKMEPYANANNAPDKMSLANLVDLVRITHPKSTPIIDELIKTGKVQVADSAQTWEKLRSAKKTWYEITEQIRLPHMALLRNLRNIIEEFSSDMVTDPQLLDTRVNELAKLLITGVKTGKQFPFRYFSAYKALIKFSDSKYAEIFNDALNQCLLESLDTIPEMNGYVDCLTDNSGSARGTLATEYGSVSVYEIANLSSILTAFRSTKGGSVWVFGDKLKEYKVSKERPIMEQLTEINDIGQHIGFGTETGIWLFWEKALLNKNKLDNVFIYSDMQAGYGDLYVTNAESDAIRLEKVGAKFLSGCYIDVMHLVKTYREQVYSKVNVFSVQVAGYDNNILPDILYRGAILSGWTGKEAKLAYEMSKVWDEVEALVCAESV